MQKKINDFWKGDFGNKYIGRNNKPKMIDDNITIFKRSLLKNKIKIKSILEYGANVGLNLIALNKIYKKLDISAVEINPKACIKLKNNIKNINIYNQSIFSFSKKFENLNKKFDLTLSKTVLIHVDPNQIKKAYEALYSKSKKYILIIEYHNPTPVKIKYRGHINKLFKRDFAGDMLNIYKDLKIIDYGFFYSKDPSLNNCDDLNWFLLTK